ncbi:hypothetical protein [Streptomyces sp. NPDC056672]|uniref:hypothetical protein n=1 Tax=Streptomyces sp. NPDC056672 TaxID=3345906 RepID=UPI003685277E
MRKPPADPPEVLSARLYELHQATGRDQEYLERWPGDAALSGVLQFAQEHAAALKGSAFQAAAILRIQLAEWLRLSADPFQLAAIDDARADGVSWEEIALKLGYLSAAGKPNLGSAKNLRDRLYVVVNGRPGDRRQPQVARLIDKRAAEERLARARFIEAGEARYREVDAAARALLEQYEAGQILVNPDDDGYWWEALADAVAKCETATERATLSVYLRGVLRETYAYAVARKRPASTERARPALKVATGLADFKVPDAYFKVEGHRRN